jgi:cardiolipin synthase
LSIPNLITLARILLVPVVVWSIATGRMYLAFMLFLAAAISDAVDGFRSGSSSWWCRAIS